MSDSSGYAPAVKKRLDVLLVERGLAESRAQAQALVLAGRVRGYGKPGVQVEESQDLELPLGKGWPQVATSRIPELAEQAGGNRG